MSALITVDSPEIIAAAERIRGSYGRAVQEMVQIGRDLIFIKEKLPHGGFLPYLASEFEMSDDTANNYMNMARSFTESQIPKISEFGASVIQLIARRSTPETAKAELLDRADEGEKITVAMTKEVIERHKREIAEAEARGRQSAADDLEAEKARADAAEAEREEADRETNRAKQAAKQASEEAEAVAADRERKARDEERAAADRRLKRKEGELERERRKISREIDAAKAKAKAEGVAEAKAQVDVIDTNVRDLEARRDALTADIAALEEQRRRVKSQDESDVSTFGRAFADLEDTLETALGLIGAHSGIITEPSLKRNAQSIRRLMGYLSAELDTAFDQGAVVIDMVAG